MIDLNIKRNRPVRFELVPILGNRIWRVASSTSSLMHVFLTLGDAIRFARKRAGLRRAQLVIHGISVEL
jgi:hypothetical protein